MVTAVRPTDFLKILAHYVTICTFARIYAEAVHGSYLVSLPHKAVAIKAHYRNAGDEVAAQATQRIEMKSKQTVEKVQLKQRNGNKT